MEIPNKNVTRALEGEDGLTRVAEGVTGAQTLQPPNRLKSQKAMCTRSYKLLKSKQRCILKCNCMQRQTLSREEQVIANLH